MFLLRSAKDFVIGLADAFRKCVNDNINFFLSLLKTLSQVIEHEMDPEIGAVRYLKQSLLKITFNIIGELILFCQLLNPVFDDAAYFLTNTLQLLFSRYTNLRKSFH